MAFATGLVLVLVLVRKNWIEAVVPIDPDQDNGTLEALILVSMAILTITCTALARHEWLRARPALERE